MYSPVKIWRNLYPLRTLHPDDLIKVGLKDDIHKDNLKEINSYIEALIKNIRINPNVLLALNRGGILVFCFITCFENN